MLKSVNRISVFKCVSNDGLTFSPRTANWIQITRRSSGALEKKPKGFPEVFFDMSFTTFLQHRQEQAKRSFIVKIHSPKEQTQICNLCNTCGSIQNVFQYHCYGQYLLIEMSAENELKSVLTKAYGMKNNFELCNQFLEISKDASVEKTNSLFGDFEHDVIKVSDVAGKKVLNNELNKKVNSLAECIKSCYNSLKVNELEIRKKFLLCRQTEVLCGGFLSNAVAFPFGSSVTGFGVNGCDLDIALLPLSNFGSLVTSQKVYSDYDSEAARKHLEYISELMRQFMAGCSNLYYIKNARVPIVKYKNLFTNVECDFSLYNPHGVAVSLMCYTIASFDWRIRALVMFFKLWAQKVGVVSKQPGTRISNFSLSILVLFFLQQIDMAPPWNIFPCSDNQFLLKDSSIVSFNDLHSQKKKCNSNNKSVGEMFKMFFEFYRNFNFKKWGISIRDAKVIKNVDKYPLYIENPIYPGVNISVNVRATEVIETQELMNDVLEVLLESSGQEQLQRLFNLSMKKKKESIFSAF